MSRGVVTMGTMVGLATAVLLFLAAAAVTFVMTGHAPSDESSALVFRHGMLVGVQFDPWLAACPALPGED